MEDDMFNPDVLHVKLERDVVEDLLRYRTVVLVRHVKGKRITITMEKDGDV